MPDVSTIIADPVVPRYKDNPYFPLPHDYYSLTSDGQRLARLNTVSLQKYGAQWLMYSWYFFRLYYLVEPSLQRPGFFHKHYRPSPPFHWNVIYSAGKHQLNLFQAPRGFAKSTIIMELELLLLLSRHNFEILSIVATGDKVKKKGAKILTQLEDNTRLNDDFRGEHKSLKPPRSPKNPWSSKSVKLRSGSWWNCMSVAGTLLGERPELITCDDPEQPPEESTDLEKLLREWKSLLFNVLMPMIVNFGSAIFWIGTNVYKRSFLNVALQGEDERFKYWNRINLQARTPDGKLLWRERATHAVLDEMREKMGVAEFQSQMMGNPSAEDAKIFSLHPTYGYYSVLAPDGNLHANPLTSTATLSHCVPTVDSEGHDSPQEIRHAFGEWASHLYRFTCIDRAYSLSKDADYSVVAVMGVDHNMVLWILDLWVGRALSSELLDKIWERSALWRVKLVCPEDVGIQTEMTEQIRSEVFLRTIGSQWKPRIKPIRPPHTVKKGKRIAGIEWRFNKYAIKFPRAQCESSLSADWGYKEALKEIRNFTVSLYGMDHDDVIDAISMSQFVVKSRPSVIKHGFEKRPSALELLRSGRHSIPSIPGLPAMSALNASDLTIEDLDAILGSARALREQIAQRGRRPEEASSPLGGEYTRRPVPLTSSPAGTQATGQGSGKTGALP